MSQNQNYDGTERGVTRRDALRYLAASAAGALVDCNVFSPRYGHPDRTEPNGFEAAFANAAKDTFTAEWRERHAARLDLLVESELGGIRRGSLGRKVRGLNKGEYALIAVGLPKDGRSDRFPDVDSNEWVNFTNAHLLHPKGYTWNSTG